MNQFGTAYQSFQAGPKYQRVSLEKICGKTIGMKLFLVTSCIITKRYRQLKLTTREWLHKCYFFNQMECYADVKGDN